jgi:hypothetical protein
MRLMGEARRRGLSIRVADIMTSPVLCDMAAALSETTVETSSPQEDHSVRPFELVTRVGSGEARQVAAALCDLPEDTIEDMFPCTPMQEGLIALNVADPSAYIWRWTKELSLDVDIARLRNAFDAVVRAHPVLRTRIVDLPGKGFVQVVTGEMVPWYSVSSGKEHNWADDPPTMRLGDPLAGAAILQEGPQRSFVLTMHHAIYDAWSIGILSNAFAQAYQGLCVAPPPPFQAFVKAVLDPEEQSAGKKAWKNHLAGNEAAPFPRIPSSGYQAKPDTVRVSHVTKLGWNAMEVTKAVVVRAALALTIAHMENVQDVIFGTTVAGRSSAAVPGVDKMTGPTMATIPTRVTLAQDETVGTLLARLQAEGSMLEPYQHLGLRAIGELSEDAKRATAFQTLLVVQPRKKTLESANDTFRIGSEPSDADHDLRAISRIKYAVVMECQLEDDGLKIKASFDSYVISDGKMAMLLEHLETVLRKLCHSVCQALRLTEIEWLGERGLRKIWSWNSNANVPESVDLPVHELLALVSQRQPRAQAICAWDGDWTYEELDYLSDRLAYRLLDEATAESTTVPIFIEKSRWVPVAMLAVMKAGLTSCLLDSALPLSRLQSIVQQIRPEMMLASPGQADFARTLLHDEPIVVDAAHLAELPAEPSIRTLPTVAPDTPLYIVFTSGSTGTPKGVVISHQSMSSALVHLGSRRSVGPQTRELAFSSLAFDGTFRPPCAYSHRTHPKQGITLAPRSQWDFESII